MDKGYLCSSTWFYCRSHSTLMNLWDEIVISLNEEMDQIKTNLVEGGAGDYATYKELSGFYQGLAWARNDLTRIVKTRFHDEEGD